LMDGDAIQFNSPADCTLTSERKRIPRLEGVEKGGRSHFEGTIRR
jgi:hypothetical protein